MAQSGETPLMLAKKDFELEVVAVLEDACKIAELRNDANASQPRGIYPSPATPSRGSGAAAYGQRWYEATNRR